MLLLHNLKVLAEHFGEQLNQVATRETPRVNHSGPKTPYKIFDHENTIVWGSFILLHI